MLSPGQAEPCDRSGPREEPRPQGGTGREAVPGGAAAFRGHSNPCATRIQRDRELSLMQNVELCSPARQSLTLSLKRRQTFPHEPCQGDGCTPLEGSFHVCYFSFHCCWNFF